MATVSAIGLNWLQLLEKEFDLSFVDSDSCLAQIFAIVSDTEEGVNVNQFNDLMVNICDARQHLTAISSVFTQLVHKTVTIANNNQNLTKELEELRRELCEAKAVNKLNEEINKNCENDNKNESKNRDSFCSNFSFPNERNSFEILKSRNTTENNEILRQKSRQLEVKNEECDQLRKENHLLRRQTLQLQSELFGSRLAAKYLDKELAGRIQQIQLLGRETKDADHDRLWNQLEAEIHLHRHKTVIRACRANCVPGQPLAAPEGHNSLEVKRRQGIGNYRWVTVEKDPNEGLGVSITGGKEHGVPIIISQIYANTPAARTGALYVGDAILSVNSIDLRDAKHADAAFILANQSGKCVLEVVFVAPNEHTDDEESVGCADDEEVITGLGISRGNYPFYDSQVIDANAIESNDYYNSETINETESLDGSASQANETVVSLSSSPAKRYPGVAKLSSLPNTNSIAINDNKTDENLRQTINCVNSIEKIETLIE